MTNFINTFKGSVVVGRSKIKYLGLLTMFLLSSIATACNMPTNQFGAQQTPVAVAQVHSLVTHHPNATATSTPFQPIGPTATHTITLTPTVTNTPTATEIVNTSTPTLWNTNLEQPEDLIKIMVLGNDYRPTSGYRTDVMVLVSINPESKTVNAISFPRDLYVEIPGRGLNRLNVAQPFGGFYLLASTMELNFWVRPDYYIMTNFVGFANIINSLGGIDIQAAKYLGDRCDLSWGVDGYCYIGSGAVHMDGETALWYVRSRYTSNDFDRTRRQQEVVLGILNKFLSLDVVAKAPEIYNTYLRSVETNIPLDVVLSLIAVAPYLSDSSRINRYYIGPGETTDYVTDSGAMVLLPNKPAIQAIIHQAIYQ
jgi:LCP family protein required for cell wall assembly